MDNTASLTTPFCYAVIYHCNCGCQPPKRDLDYISPGYEYERMEDPAIHARVKAAAERWADDRRAKGYLDVRVEPRYATPDVGSN